MSFRAVFILIPVICVFSFAACSRCSDEPPLKESKAVEGTVAMPWEKLPLSTSEKEFRTSLAALAGISDNDTATRIKCTSQVTIDVIDPKSGTITERPGKGLSNCVLLQAQRGKSWRLVSARGEFLKKSLACVTLKFTLDDFEAIKQELQTRFGQGELRELKEHSILGEEAREATLWSIDGETWALWKTMTDVGLVRQSPKIMEQLPPAPDAPKKGVPVNLDDIGLGGGLDLDEPLPEIPTLDLDAGSDI